MLPAHELLQPAGFSQHLVQRLQDRARECDAFIFEWLHPSLRNENALFSHAVRAKQASPCPLAVHAAFY